MPSNDPAPEVLRAIHRDEHVSDHPSIGPKTAAALRISRHALRYRRRQLDNGRSVSTLGCTQAPDAFVRCAVAAFGTTMFWRGVLYRRHRRGPTPCRIWRDGSAVRVPPRGASTAEAPESRIVGWAMRIVGR